MKGAEVRALRARAHHLKPVVWIGNAGPAAPVLVELEQALDHHELIKVKIAGSDREQFAATVQSICHGTGAQVVQSIGRIAVFYRARPAIDHT
jgi:RNA-binding protein